MLITKDIVTREGIIAAIQGLGRELGRAPRFTELRRAAGVRPKAVIGLFGNYGNALKESGFAVEWQNGTKIAMEDLFYDWRDAARKMGRIPSVWDYEKASRYSVRPLKLRFKRWKLVAKGLLEYGDAKALWAGWEDVREMTHSYVEQQAAKEQMSARAMAARACTFRPAGEMSGVEGGKTYIPAEVDANSLYGEPMTTGPMAAAPTNEMGVVFLFGALARELGFVVLKLQSTAFPDCEAWRRLEKGRWQRVRIEFEFESRNFVTHNHDPRGCDLIVCWEHNWAECPVEVVNLSKLPGLP